MRGLEGRIHAAIADRSDAVTELDQLLPHCDRLAADRLLWLDVAAEHGQESLTELPLAAQIPAPLAEARWARGLQGEFRDRPRVARKPGFTSAGFASGFAGRAASASIARAARVRASASAAGVGRAGPALVLVDLGGAGGIRQVGRRGRRVARPPLPSSRPGAGPARRRSSAASSRTGSGRRGPRVRLASIARAPAQPARRSATMPRPSGQASRDPIGGRRGGGENIRFRFALPGQRCRERHVARPFGRPRPDRGGRPPTFRLLASVWRAGLLDLRRPPPVLRQRHRRGRGPARRARHADPRPARRRGHRRASGR